MAVTSIVLDIKANTDRALNDFKRFSAQLDNKFLISGLKLDVVRNALGQINREFQKAIGEQGLQAGQSLRAAQNQAAMLTQTFKSFSSTASLDMAQQFSSAFSDIAVRAGGTAQDIQKALSATPFISTNLSEDMRKALGEGVLSFQRDFRRAGLGGNFGDIARQFLAGQLTAGEMVESGDAMQAEIGRLLTAKTGTQDYIGSAQQRSEALLQIVSDPQFRRQLEDMAKRAYGFRGIIEDLNTRLFNPEKGIFGSLRQVTMAVGDKTTVLDETTKLIDSIFGQQGLFVNFFKQVGKIFGIEDPLKVVINGVRWVTRQINALNKFIQSPEMQGIVKLLQEVFTRIKEFVTNIYNTISTDLQDPNSTIRQIGDSISNFFKGIYDTVRAGDWDPSRITKSIREIGANIRGLISKIGEDIRGADIGKQGAFFFEIFRTIIEEVARTLGTAIKEAIRTVFSPKGAALLGGAIQTLASAIGGLLKGLFEDTSIVEKIGLSAALAGIVAIFAKKLGTGLLGLVDKLIRAFPGGNALSEAIRRRLPTSLGGGQNADPRTFEGGERGFQAQILRLVSQIRDCVCRGGLGGRESPDIDVDGDSRRRTDAGRRRVQNLGYSGPRRGSSVPPLGSGGFPMEGPIDRNPRYFRPVDVANRYNRRYGSGGGRRIVSRAFTPLVDGFRDIALEGAANTAVSGSIDRSRGNVAARFNRRYGSGGTRAVLGRGLRNIPRGRLGLAAGLGLAGIGLLGLGAGKANSAEIDPTTGQPVQSPGMGAGAAFGAIGMGAAEGALTGAMFGPWGAAIGGVLGAGIALMDKGTRDAAGKWVSELMSSIGKFATELIAGASKFISGITDSLGKAAQSVVKFFITDLPKIWLSGMRTLYIDIPKKLLDFGQELGKSMLNSVLKFDLGQALRDTWENITNLFKDKKDGARAVGGNVYANSSYLVGERGPELFLPTTNGSIINNATLSDLASRPATSVSNNPTFNISINVNGNMGAGDVESLRGPVLAIIQDAWEEVTSATISRGAIV